MATSGTTSYSVTEREIIEEAASHLGVFAQGQAMEADEIAPFRRKLNMLMKQWTAQIDFAPGLKMWTRRRGWLFLQKDQVKYSLGPSGDECAAESYATTTTTAAASGGASTIAVTSATGIVVAYRIGVLLSSGSMHWTTVEAVSSLTITLNTALPSAAALGARVFCYQTKMVRPFSLVSTSLRKTTGEDLEIDPTMTVEEYEALAKKSTSSQPTRLYFEAQRTNASVFLDYAPSDLNLVLRMVYLSYIEDTTAATQDVDFPAEWYRALAAQLAIDAAPAFAKPVSADLRIMRDEALRMAQNAYPAKSLAFYQSCPDEY